MTRDMFLLLIFATILVWLLYDILKTNIKIRRDEYQEAVSNFKKLLSEEITKEEFDKNAEDISKKIGYVYIPILPIIPVVLIIVVIATGK